MATFGPREPLLRAASTPVSSGAAALTETCVEADEGIMEEEASADERSSPPAHTMGWCTFAGCSETFSSWETHVDHHKQRHILATALQFYCTICLERPRTYDRQAHLAEHDGPKEVRCDECSARFTRKFSLEVHRVQFHRRDAGPDMAAGFCFCGTRSATWKDHVEHFVDRHWDPALVCRLCLATLGSAEALGKHAALHEQRDKCEACPLCAAQFFLNGGGLTYHARSYHRM